MQLKATVKVIKDPKNQQELVNRELAEHGFEAPEIAHQGFAAEQGVYDGANASQQSRTETPNPTNPTVMAAGVLPPAIEASQGVPVANQPLGARVVIHQATAVQQVSANTRIHVPAQPVPSARSQQSNVPVQPNASVPKALKKARRAAKAAAEQAASKTVKKKTAKKTAKKKTAKKTAKKKTAKKRSKKR